MTLHLELSTQVSDRLERAAGARGMGPAELAEDLIAESLMPESGISSIKHPEDIDAENAAAIAWLDQRLKDEATDDPEDIRRAEKDLADFKRNLNANRAETGERLVFP